MRLPSYCTVAASLMLSACSLTAADRVFVFGGGYSPSGNQVSLEKNVQYFQRIMPILGLAEAPQHILFADGKDPDRDLQVLDPKHFASDNVHLAAQILGSDRGIDHLYRTNNVESVSNSCTTKSIDSYFDEAEKFPEQDRLLVYYTGHGGGSSDKKAPRNTDLRLWNGEKLKVNEFVKRLDKLPKTMPVVLVMVQCHSGGFADVIFKDGDEKKELSEHQRCGFFSTVPERVAAGCTPDINEENYQEYSTFFWAALSGQSRLGDTIVKPDYNNDKVISFNEAHAYVTLTSDTIDIPIKTSDIFLRKFADLKDDDKATLSVKSKYDDIIKAAGSIDKKVLNGLSDTLKLSDDDRMKEVRELEKSINEKKKKIDSEIKSLDKDLASSRSAIARDIRSKWPELANPFHPLAQKLLQDEKGPLYMEISKHEKCAAYCELRDKREKLSTEKHDLARQEAKVQRFIRAFENVVLEQRLQESADADIKKSYEKLIELESGTLSKKG